MKRLQVINIAAYILNVFVTYASQAILPKLGGKTNGEVSKEFTSIVTPAGYAFTIWAVIFIGAKRIRCWSLVVPVFWVGVLLSLLFNNLEKRIRL